MTTQLQRLQRYIRDSSGGKPVVVAWSGGVDSTLVAAVALEELGDNLRVMTVDSEFIARSDMARAEQLAAQLSLPLTVVNISMLADSGVRSNGKDRCYLCKKRMIAAIRKTVAKEAGTDFLIMDGTNADDDPERPGRRALEEAGVVSPLAQCGLDKDKVRALAAKIGLPNANLPSNSCLATRVQNHGLDEAVLGRIELVEQFLVDLGFSGTRAKFDDLKVIIEIPRGSTTLLEQHHEQIKGQIEKMNLYLAGYGWR